MFGWLNRRKGADLGDSWELEQKGLTTAGPGVGVWGESGTLGSPASLGEISEEMVGYLVRPGTRNSSLESL